MSEKIVQLNEELIRGQIKELVRSSAEETLNELLEKEAESLTQAARCDSRIRQAADNPGRFDARAERVSALAPNTLDFSETVPYFV